MIITVHHDQGKTGAAFSDLRAKTYVQSPEGYLNLFDDDDRIVATFAPGGWVGVHFADVAVKSLYGEEAR